MTPDKPRFFVVPVVDDVPQEVGVGLDRDRGEEVAADDLAPARQPGGLQVPPGPLDDVGEVEEDAPHLGIPAQDADQVRAVAAADVGQDVDARQVIGIENGLRLSTVYRRHGGVEDLGLFGVLAQVLEDRLAVEAVEGGLAGADALQQVAP